MRTVWFSFNGRIDRKVFWLQGVLPILALWGIWYAFWFLVYVATALWFGSESYFRWQESPTGTALLSSADLGLGAATIYILFALLAKRWHDIGHSGWFSLFCLIPFVGLVLLVAVGCIKGTPESNKYGVQHKFAQRQEQGEIP